MVADTTSAVFWLQTPHWHGDVRVPAARPDFYGCTALAQCTPAQRQWLAGQKGFAGLTEVTERTVAPAAAASAQPIAAADTGAITCCQWHRQVDFQPARPDRDFGRIVFFDNGAALDEFGVDAAYRETWVRLPHSVGPTDAWRRAADGFGELLLVAGACFFYLRDRRQPLPAANDLLALSHRDDAPALLDMELSFGRWDIGAAAGEISHSTLPWREGKALAFGSGWSPV